MYTLFERSICLSGIPFLANLAILVTILVGILTFGGYYCGLFNYISLHQTTILQKLESFWGLITGVAFLGLLLVGFTTVAYGIFADMCRVPRILSAFERGSLPMPKDEFFVDRPEILTMTHILKSAGRGYMVIVGQHGTGKTTILRHACSEAGAGILFIDVPLDHTRFPDVFAKTIDHFFSDDDITWWKVMMYATKLTEKLETVPVTFDEKWNSCEIVLEEVADRWSKHHKSPLVVVIDNLNKLSKQDEIFFIRLQNLAKIHADRGTVMFVFVSSEGHAPAVMQGQSEWSRARLIEIGDFREQEAIKYLLSRGMEEKVAINAIDEFLGGRIIDLRNAANDYEVGISIQAIKDNMMSVMSNRYIECGLAEPHDKPRWTVLKQILDSPSLEITLDEANNILMETKAANDSIEATAELRKIFEANVISLGPVRNEVAFESPASAAFARMVAGVKGTPKRQQFDKELN